MENPGKQKAPVTTQLRVVAESINIYGTPTGDLFLITSNAVCPSDHTLSQGLTHPGTQSEQKKEAEKIVVFPPAGSSFVEA